MALPAESSALSAALAASLVAALVSASTAFSTLVSFSTASSVLDSHAARPSARTATVTAIFFMIVPLHQSCPNRARASACRAIRTGQRAPIQRSAVPRNCHISTRPTVRRMARRASALALFDAYKDIFISLSGDCHASARRPVPGARRPDSGADPRALEAHGIVGRRTGAGPRTEPAAGLAPLEDPRRRGSRRTAQGRQLGVPDAGRSGPHRPDVRAARLLGGRADPGAVRG